MTRFLRLLMLSASLCLAACTTTPERPDLARLYEADVQNDRQPPVILIHGLMGSTLVEPESGKEFWPGSIGTLAFSEYRELARMKAAEADGGALVPGDLFYGVGRTDYYQALIDTLEGVGRFKRGTPGTPVQADDRRRYYVLLYDWRKENLEAVRQLHALIDQIRVDYRDPDLAVDILAHSNGGLIANYYLRYGPNDVLTSDEFIPWEQGAHRIRRMVLLGTPSLGAVTSLERLQQGFKIAWRTVPVEVLVTFATPFEALPHPDAQVVYSPEGQPIPFNIYDADAWRVRRWSVFSPDVEARVLAAAPDRATGELNMAQLQAYFVRHLARARQFQRALSAPMPANGVEVAVFGGDCTLTPARAVLDRDAGGERLVIRPDQVKARVEGVDYERLLLQPGDGLVTRDAQLGRGLPPIGGRAGNTHPVSQSFFLCERHDQLSVNPYFQNNLLYFLLGR
ncbi:lipase/acyltransferase domain-containing protein [Arenimonas sp. MALMAid1274]|uniref:esterase/lipase family protein n=1 Tax=Arenimonas sp. MALMAid1274 TaxID=3411630 RepID=UPI003BA2540A